MPRSAQLSNADRTRLQRLVDTESLRQIAARAGVHHATLTNALRGRPVRHDAAVALARVAPKVRAAEDFATALTTSWHAPASKSPVLSWDLETIRRARDAQFSGDFELPVKLATAMRADDALFTAYHHRIAPQAAIQTKLVPARGARGKAVSAKAAAAITIDRATLMGIQGTMVNHGLAIGYNERDANEDGTVIRFKLTEWPLEHVRWSPVNLTLETRTDQGGWVPITHGDGVWTVFSRFKTAPWTQEACVLPAALIWASHAEGISSWAGGAKAHGLAQIVGKLPAGFAVEDESGGLTPQAQAFLRLIHALSTGDTGAGIAPAGSEIDFIANGSNAWQIFTELTTDRNKAAARVYQGTDATLGSVGGAPGVDISALFGVLTTKLQGDFEAIETALKIGVYDPWTAINEGSSQYAPRLVYQLPDPDADAKSAQAASKRTRLTNAIREMRDQKLEVSQAVVDTLAAEFDVRPTPNLASLDTQTSTILLAPTDVAKVVLVREARASQGLPPFNDVRDTLTITELDEWLKAKAIASTAPAVPSP